MAPDFKIEEKNNRIIITINPRLYSSEAVYGAAYVFLDKAYLFLEGNPQEKILVYIKGKETLNQKELADLAGDFSNELLNYSLRNRISKDNQKLREYILARALSVTDANDNCKNNPGSNPPQKKQRWKKDPLNTALPWDKKYKI
jgi:His-Xaa-Ser system protein HxsD